MINLIDLIAGAIMVIAGIVTIFGMANFRVVLAGIGLLIEGIRVTKTPWVFELQSQKHLTMRPQ